MVRFDPRLLQYGEARTSRFYKLLSERVRDLPLIRSAGYTENPPLGLGNFGSVSFVPEGFQMPRDRENLNVTSDTVDEGFFQTMGIPILRGRGFRPSDDEAAPRVAVVNENFARHYWPNANPVGKRIRLGSATGASVEVVGVAQAIKYKDGFESTIDFVYLPLAQHPAAKMVLLVRAASDPIQLVQPVKEAVHSIDPNMNSTNAGKTKRTSFAMRRFLELSILTSP